MEDGLEYILTHFREPIWPRTISTKATGGRQIVVASDKEALAWYKAANWMDCRISAYPPNALNNPFGIQRFQGIRTSTPIDLIVLVDLDRSNFKTDRALRLALTRTVKTINEKLHDNAIPTVLWSGRSYHVIQVINSIGVNLEYERIFADMSGDQTSRRFIQFAEEFLSNCKSDKNHSNTVSFAN